MAILSAYTDGYLISEENYSKNLKNGMSVKFYPDSTIAEKLTYLNDIKQENGSSTTLPELSALNQII